MAATKASSTIIPSTSNAAGSTTTGTAVDMRTAYGAVVTMKLTNGGTAPTVAASAYVYISSDGSTNKLYAQFTGDAVASSVREFAIELPLAVMYVNVVVKDNTGAAVTCEAFAFVATGI